MGRLVRRLDARGPQRRAVADRAPHKFTESGPNSVDKFVRDELAAMFFARLTTFERTANADENVGRTVALVHGRH